MRFAILASIALIATPALSGPVDLTKADVAQIKAAVAYGLLDPDSAKFRNIRAVEITKANGVKIIRVCGEVNGTNSMGGYAGFEWFGGVMKDGRFKRQDFFGACE